MAIHRSGYKWIVKVMGWSKEMKYMNPLILQKQ